MKVSGCGQPGVSHRVPNGITWEEMLRTEGIYCNADNPGDHYIVAGDEKHSVLYYHPHSKTLIVTDGRFSCGHYFVKVGKEVCFELRDA